MLKPKPLILRKFQYFRNIENLKLQNFFNVCKFKRIFRKFDSTWWKLIKQQLIKLHIMRTIFHIVTFSNIIFRHITLGGVFQIKRCNFARQEINKKRRGVYINKSLCCFLFFYFDMPLVEILCFCHREVNAIQFHLSLFYLFYLLSNYSLSIYFYISITLQYYIHIYNSVIPN